MRANLKERKSLNLLYLKLPYLYAPHCSMWIPALLTEQGSMLGLSVS